MKLIIFIRHGETNHSQQLKFQSNNSALTTDSKRLISKSSKLVKEFAPSVIIQSTLRRSMETARLLVGKRNIPVVTNELFDEIKEPESISGKDISSELSFLDQALAKYDTEPNYKIDESESLSEFIKRVREAQEFLLQSSDNKIIISSHGFFMRIFLLASLFPDDIINSETIQFFRKKTTIGKLHSSLFTIKENKFVLEKWNIKLSELMGKNA